MTKTENNDDVFNNQKYGVTKMDAANLEIGRSYSLYGIITEIHEVPGIPENLILIVNFNTKLYLFNLTEERKAEIKRSAFESAIFVTRLDEVIEDPAEKHPIRGECLQIVMREPETPKYLS